MKEQHDLASSQSEIAKRLSESALRWRRGLPKP